MSVNDFQSRIDSLKREEQERLNAIEREKQAQLATRLAKEQQAAREFQAAVDRIRQLPQYAELVRQAHSAEIEQMFRHIYQLEKPLREYRERGFLSFLDSDPGLIKKKPIPFELKFMEIQVQRKEYGLLAGIEISMPAIVSLYSEWSLEYVIEFYLDSQGKSHYVYPREEYVADDGAYISLFRYVYTNIDDFLDTIAKIIFDGNSVQLRVRVNSRSEWRQSWCLVR